MTVRISGASTTFSLRATLHQHVQFGLKEPNSRQCQVFSHTGLWLQGRGAQAASLDQKLASCQSTCMSFQPFSAM